MKTNSQGIKYFPINLQKKSMMYSGSQPKINFSPPIKNISNSNNKYEGYSTKIKKDYSTKKNTDIDYQQKIQQHQHQSQQLQEGNILNKSANIVIGNNQKRSQPPKYSGYFENKEDENEKSSNNKSFNQFNQMYKKMNKLPPSSGNANNSDNLLGSTTEYNNSKKYYKDYGNNTNNDLNFGKHGQSYNKNSLYNNLTNSTNNNDYFGKSKYSFNQDSSIGINAANSVISGNRNNHQNNMLSSNTTNNSILNQKNASPMITSNKG